MRQRNIPDEQWILAHRIDVFRTRVQRFSLFQRVTVSQCLNELFVKRRQNFNSNRMHLDVDVGRDSVRYFGRLSDACHAKSGELFFSWINRFCFLQRTWADELLFHGS